MSLMLDVHRKLRERRAGKLTKPRTLEEIGFTQEILDDIDRAAWSETYGAMAAYIPELINLEKIDPTRRVLAVGDFYGNIMAAGNGDLEQRFSIQSCVKPFIYAFALMQGDTPESISGISANALPFNKDKILDPELGHKRADHPLNNAGAISASKAIGDNFEGPGGFLEFMKLLTGDPELEVDTEVFRSEHSTGFNNMAICYRLGEGGRFRTHKEIQQAGANYFRSCSLTPTVKGLLKAQLVLAAAGMNLGERMKTYKPGEEAFFDEKYLITVGGKALTPDMCVRVVNAEGSGGRYQHQGEESLTISGMRATTGKTGVGGGDGEVFPGDGGSAGWNPLLDGAGNSVYVKNANILTNEVFAADCPTPVRLTPEATERARLHHEREDMQRTVPNVTALIAAGHPSKAYKLKPYMKEEMRAQHTRQLGLLDRA